jgi:hypothetical protein
MPRVGPVRDRRSWGNVARIFSTATTDSAQSHDVSVAARIREIRLELAALERQQRAQFLVTVASIVPGHIDFNAGELFALCDHHPVLVRAFADLRIRNARSLGRKLQQIAAAGIDGAGVQLQRIGHDRGGVIWTLR